MTDRIDSEPWQGTVFDRANDPESGGLGTSCRMVCCDGVPVDGHQYCDTCRQIWPDLTLVLRASIEKVKKEKGI